MIARLGTHIVLGSALKNGNIDWERIVDQHSLDRLVFADDPLNIEVVISNLRILLNRLAVYDLLLVVIFLFVLLRVGEVELELVGRDLVRLAKEEAPDALIDVQVFPEVLRDFPLRH